MVAKAQTESEVVDLCAQYLICIKPYSEEHVMTALLSYDVHTRGPGCKTHGCLGKIPGVR